MTGRRQVPLAVRPCPITLLARFRVPSMAFPLRVYRDNVFVEPGNVNETLTDAMVEVYFTIMHFYMREKMFDTFS
jgi:hypothetical protein